MDTRGHWEHFEHVTDIGVRGFGPNPAEAFAQAEGFGIALPDRELACAPIKSDVGQHYLGAMRAAINCALANRQILAHLARGVFADLFPGTRLDLLSQTCMKESGPVAMPAALLVRLPKGRRVEKS